MCTQFKVNLTMPIVVLIHPMAVGEDKREVERALRHLQQGQAGWGSDGYGPRKAEQLHVPGRR